MAMHTLLKRKAVEDSARVLIVDDSAVARAVMGRMIDAANGFTVAAAVPDVHAAMAFLNEERVDILLLDIEMPGVDGLTALPDLLAAGQGAKILVVSSSCAEGAAATIQALTLGAADTLVKPGVGNFVGRFADVLTDKLTRLVDREPRGAAPQAPAAKAQATGHDFDVVAIGASTGGIHAMGQLLRAIPASFQLPILVTQHLPGSFMPYFAAQLAVLGGRPAVVAEDHMRLLRGRIYIAPGDAHMRCMRFGEGVSLRLSTERAASGCMPSVDPMLEAIADVFGQRALVIILSGMGKDGASGARRVAQAGGVVAAQDRASSVVWGMPGAVVKAGDATLVMPPDEIGQFIAAQRRP